MLIYASKIFSYFKYIIAVIIVLAIIYYYESIIYYFLSFDQIQSKFSNYYSKLYNVFSFKLVSSEHIIDNPYRTSTANIISNTLRYGIINLVAFVGLVIFYLVKVIKNHSWNRLIILLVILLYSQKGPYYFTPLILFYINYLNIYFVSKVKGL